MTAANAFIGKREQPNDSELSSALGAAKPAWDQFLSSLAQEFEVTTHEWRCYSAKSGWSLKAKRKERTIVWLAPLQGRFTVVFILGAKAMQEARALKWSEKVLKAIDNAPKYPEGFGVRLEVKSVREIKPLKQLAAIKIAH